MGKIADIVEKVLNVNYECPECGEKPPKESSPLGHFEKISSTGNKYTLQCKKCSHKFSAYICYKCGRGYATKGDFNIFQKSKPTSPVQAYDCKCGNNLYVNQEASHTHI